MRGDFSGLTIIEIDVYDAVTADLLADFGQRRVDDDVGVVIMIGVDFVEVGTTISQANVVNKCIEHRVRVRFNTNPPDWRKRGR